MGDEAHLKYTFTRLTGSRLVLTHEINGESVDEFRGFLAQFNRETPWNRAIAEFIAGLARANPRLASAALTTTGMRHFSLLGSGYQLAEVLGLLGIVRIMYNQRRSAFEVLVTSTKPMAAPQPRQVSIRRFHRYPDGSKPDKKVRLDTDVDVPHDASAKPEKPLVPPKECENILRATLACEPAIKDWADLV